MILSRDHLQKMYIQIVRMLSVKVKAELFRVNTKSIIRTKCSDERRRRCPEILYGRSSSYFYPASSTGMLCVTNVTQTIDCY